MQIRIRNATSADLEYLREVLGWAASWHSAEIDAQLLARPAVSRYVEGFPRAGDAGVVAEDEVGRRIGAAWYRRFSQAEPGFGFVAPDVPEVTVAVGPEHRGRGIGTALLEALVARAASEGVRALILSVEEDNPALLLYERLGFERVAREGNAWTMRRNL